MTKPERQDNGLGEALRRVDAGAAAEGSAVTAVEKALTAPVGKPIFNTHSNALAGEFNARAESLKAQIAEVDAKIAALNAERTDLMLTYSMLAKGMQARETGGGNG